MDSERAAAEKKRAAQEREREALLETIKALEVELASAAEREAQGHAAAAVEGGWLACHRMASETEVAGSAPPLC